ncbi:MAG: prephenate dehydrogenase/arogenate dehydrogenase family protein [Clostridia bacterium]|nr:prephenate dehydrogenase/arogenate dehydrogenase family protein [Clostridia bacterium]
MDFTDFKTVGIAGLGLIGGSFAKAYKQNSDKRVLGMDINDSTVGFAQLSGAIDGVLDDITVSECDVIFIALYPFATIEYMKRIAPLLTKKQIVIDLCGTKKEVCRGGFELASKYGFTFVGGHPMAGKHFSGFKYASAELFKGAPMVIVPPIYDDIAFLDGIKHILAPCGFGSITVTDAKKHDEIIAFTSQLAHVVSNAYVKSPTAKVHKGFSAGSYKDMTRVAWLNEHMWSELFLENKEPLLFELDTIIASLTEYRNAIATDDRSTLVDLLKDGRIAKESIDGSVKKK